MIIWPENGRTLFEKFSCVVCINEKRYIVVTVTTLHTIVEPEIHFICILSLAALSEISVFWQVGLKV